MVASKLDYIQDEDMTYEETLLKNPSNIEIWEEYIDFKHGNIKTPKDKQSLLALLHRAVIQIPNSYKFWMLLFDMSIDILNDRGDGKSKQDVHQVVELFQLGLPTLNKFPYAWVKFYEFLLNNINYVDVSFIRKEFDHGLKDLTVVQHFIVWRWYLKFADLVGGRTRFWIYYRFFEFKLKLDTFEFVGSSSDEAKSLQQIGFEDILQVLSECLSSSSQLEQFDSVFDQIIKNPQFLLKMSQPELDFYVKYVDTLVRLGTLEFLEDRSVVDKKMVKFIDDAILKFPDQMGKFQVKLALYWIKRKLFVQAIDVFETGIKKCITLKDFTMIFDTYSEFQYSRISKLSDKLDKLESQGKQDEPKAKELNSEINILFAKYEELLNQRAFMSNDVLLRQNPNNVQEWLNRIKLFKGKEEENEEQLDDKQLEKILDCYVSAIKTINPQKIPVSDVGLLSKLWIGYAGIYGKHEDIETARSIYNTATKVPFRDIEELINIWISWTEFELDHDDFDHALVVISKSVEIPKLAKTQRIDFKDTELSPQIRIHKSIKLWSMYLDLVESSGDITKTTQVYDQVLDLKIASALTFLNYASFLQENEHYEESFKVYERGVNAFKYPIAFEIWSSYLQSVVELKQKLDIKTERIRELFDDALVDCPSEFLKAIILMYGDFEEKQGSKLRSLRIYKDAIPKLTSNIEKLDLYKILILQTTQLKGLEATREIYQEAIENLPVKTHGFIEYVIMGFVNTELKLGELVRCREVLKYGGDLVVKSFDVTL
ncbi:unnamed protein product [Ambrosiozyma monospora]|uniref:Unnamed protein product n=1 Tax=Ambrosiozyma monospora TaxID=43982 RepID=A0ACB5T2N4_AMBMO|nr:unnamed protein product [Ambrosiozyma monospora]